MAREEKLYFENLDALRCFAAMFVVFHHIGLRLVATDTTVGRYLQVLFTFNYNAGFIGVSFFFVLSGFLITYLMFYELEKTKQFNVPHFYLRRFLRIWPLYFASLFVGFVLVPFFVKLNGGMHVEGASPLWYSLFFANLDNIFIPKSPSTGILAVQWSVAIEEQFYLIWPLIFAAVGKKRRFLLVLIALIGFSFVYRTMHINEKVLIHFHTFTALNELSVGGLLAYIAYHCRTHLIAALERLKPWMIMLIYLGGFAFLFFKFELSRFVEIKIAYRFLASLFFGFIILEQTFAKRSFFKVGRVKLFTSLGRVSYGLYLLHMIPVTIVVFASQRFGLSLVMSVALVLLGTIGLSYLSYHFYERPFLRLKKKVSHVRTGGV